MKKFLLSLVVMVLSLWSFEVSATTSSITFSGKYSANTVLDETKFEVGENVTLVFSKGTGSSAPQYYTSGTAVRWYGGNTLTVSSNSNITNIELTFGNSDGTNEITVNTGDLDKGTWTGNSKEVIFTVGGTSGNRRIAGVTITYEGNGDSGDTGGGETTDPEPEPGKSKEITFNFTQNGYSNGQVIESWTQDPITISFSKGSNSNAPTYYTSGTAIRAYGGNTFTVSASNQTITKIVITFGTSDGTNEITVNTGDLDKGTWTGNSKEVIFTVGGTSGNRRIAGVTITYEGNGDSGDTGGGETTDPEPEPGKSKDITFNFTQNGYSNAQVIESWKQDPITISFSKGSNSNAPTYYTTGTAIRAYGGNTFTVSASNQTITKIVITFGTGDGSNEITVNTGDLEVGTWTGNSEEVIFTVGGTSGNRRLQEIVVTYEEMSDTDKSVSTPQITCNDNTVTITCETDGASIYYTIDNDDPSENSTLYDEEFTIQETVTVKAIAIKDNISSDIATQVCTYIAPSNPDPDDPDEPGDDDNVEWNEVDFSSMVIEGTYDTAYTTRTSKDGWVATNAALITHSTASMVPEGTTGIILNGKVNSTGTLTSPTLQNGLETLTFSYGYPYSETKGFNFTVKIYQNGEEVETKNVVEASNITSNIAYNFKLENVNIEGPFVIEIINNSPTNSTSSNKDRLAIWNVKWSNYGTIKADPELSFSKKEINIIGIDGDFELPTLINEAGVEVSYTSSNTSVATVNEEGQVTILYYGSTIITATSKATDIYNAGSASYTINVSPNGPITVEEALKLIDDGYTLSAQVEGYIISITEVNTQYGNATYVIADEAEEEEEEKVLTVFRGYYLDGEKFTSDDQIEVGGKVIVEGNLLLYEGNTPEIGTGNKLISYVAPEKPFEPATIYIVGSSINGDPAEQPSEDNMLTYEEGVYTWTGDKLAESFMFSYGEGETNKIGAKEADTYIDLNQEINVEEGEEVYSLFVKDGYYIENPVITLDLENMTLTVTGELVEVESPAEPATIYIVGSSINGGPAQQPSEDNKLAYEEGVYTWTGKTLAGSFMFSYGVGETKKIGAEEADKYIVLEEVFNVEEGEVVNNISVEDGYYIENPVVTLNLEKMTLTVNGELVAEPGTTDPEVIYLKGQEISVELKFNEDGTFSGVWELEATSDPVEFYLVTDTDVYYGCTEEENTVVLNEDEESTYSMVEDGQNWKLSNWDGGTITVTVDLETMTMTLVGTSEGEEGDGIDNLYGVDGEAVIYNLQGLRVNNPAKGGIYIINGKKVMVK